jgi:hypothetical protein
MAGLGGCCAGLTMAHIDKRKTQAPNQSLAPEEAPGSSVQRTPTETPLFFLSFFSFFLDLLHLRVESEASQVSQVFCAQPPHQPEAALVCRNGGQD